MPYTKRLVIHDGTKGLTSCLRYCSDESKTDGGILINGYNCNAHFALSEMTANNEKWHTIEDDRIAYHAIQSFDWRDDITPAQVNEIGMKLCKEIYPEFQCVVFTHIDKGHLHNHIVINATNTKGRKLEDRLANEKEGLYGLRAASDYIAKEYGCHTMEEFKPIGKYKSKRYAGKEHLYEVATASWKSVIINQIEKLKEEINSFDELLERLSLEGYVIKGGKHISVKPYGKSRFTRLYKLTKDGRYSEDNLKKFFYEKTHSTLNNRFKKYTLTDKNSVLLQELDDAAKISQKSIEVTSAALKPKINYPRYYNTRYLEKKRYHELVKMIELLNDEKIYSYENLIDAIDSLKNELAQREKNYAKLKATNDTYQADLQIARIYLEKYKDYRTYQEQVQMFGAAQVRKTEEIELFEEAKEIMENAEFDEVKAFIAEAGKVQREANQEYARISYFKRRLSDLEALRGKSLIMQGYIKGVAFSEGMIDHSRSTEETYCIRLPYSELYVFLPAASVVWTAYGERAVMYLVDDEKYALYDKDGNKVDEVEGSELDTISTTEKEKMKEYYKTQRRDMV